jgi:hypothetical protein
MALRECVWLLSTLLTLVGCSGARRTVLLETGQDAPLVHVPRGVEAGPVELDEDEVRQALTELARDLRPPARPQEAARRLFEMDARGGSFLFDARTRRITPLEPGEPPEVASPEADVALTRAYLRWCERTGRRGDCLLLLRESPTVSGDARFTLALALAKGAVVAEMWEAFKDMADPEAMMAAALWTASMYAILWTVPEPATKGVAAALTTALIGYVGLDMFWKLITGFRGLMDEVDAAASFDALRDAGERFGKVLGRTGAQAFAMLAMAVLGNTATGLAAKLPKLPGAAGAASRVEAQAGVAYGAVDQVSAVAVTGEGLTIGLAPGAVAMASGEEGRTQNHHIATIRNSKSTQRGGPWTPRLKRIFDKAGMNMTEVENIVPIQGHKGPHPERYHQIVFERLRVATASCGSMAECQAALTQALHKLARAISTPGTELNRLVTKSAPR